jgi:hypothetical protein
VQSEERAIVSPGAGQVAARGRSIPLAEDERCNAAVFIAAVGFPEQCHFRRRQAGFCCRHWRERGGSTFS